MEKFVFVLHVSVCLGLLGLILLQQGKGAEVGASFGSGASQTLFGSQGAGNFMTHATAVMATVFFVTCLTLGYFAVKQKKSHGIESLLPAIQAVQSEHHSTTEPQKTKNVDLPDIDLEDSSNAPGQSAVPHSTTAKP